MSKSNMGSLRSVRDELGGAKDVNLQSLLRAEAILVDLGGRGRGRGKGRVLRVVVKKEKGTREMKMAGGLISGLPLVGSLPTLDHILGEEILPHRHQVHHRMDVKMLHLKLVRINNNSY